MRSRFPIDRPGFSEATTRGVSLVAFLLVLALASARLASAADEPNAEAAKCGKRVADAIGSYTDDTLKALASCPLTNLKSSHRLDCLTDSKTRRGLDSARAKLVSEVRKCSDRGFAGLCPMEAGNANDLITALTEGPTSLSVRLADLSSLILVKDYSPACTRPTAPVENSTYDCGSRLMQGLRQVTVDLQQCLFDCQVSNLQKVGEACVDPVSGLPTKPKVAKCVDEVISDFGETMASRCGDEPVLTELGCPAGAMHLPDLQSALSLAVASEAQSLNLKIFRSTCRGGGSTTPPPESTTKVILQPGLEERTIACGQVLDRAFFGASTGLRFAGDLNCQAATTPTNGIVVAASDVEIDLGGDFSIAGPGSSRLRTGTGILVAPGARNVSIHNARQVRYFGVGIQDSGDNSGLVVADLTVIRNAIAGIRTSTRGVLLDNVTFDRNKVGVDVSGDDTIIRESTIRRSTPAPGIGAYLRALDTGADGKAVRLSRNTIEGNLIGVVLEGGPHQVEQNDINSNQGDGVQISAAGGYVNSNSIKLNLGNGVLVTGGGNLLASNRSDQNGLSGFDVRGDGNTLSGNGAGTLSDRGNLQHGFLISGQGNLMTTNFAEANLLNGFEVRGTAAEFKGNRAKGNGGTGFAMVSSGSPLDTNAAEANTGPEFSIAPGNTDRTGNRANGRVFSFGLAGGTIE